MRERQFVMSSLVGVTQEQVSDSPTRIKSSEEGEEQDGSLIPSEPAKTKDTTRSQR